MSVQHLFRTLVDAYHVDAASTLVDDLAMRFTSETARRIYDAKRTSIPLICTPTTDLERLQGVHFLLATYGLGLAARRRHAGDVLISVRILRKHPHLEAFDSTLTIQRVQPKVEVTK